MHIISCSADPCVPHSFPTRRSSDLEMVSRFRTKQEIKTTLEGLAAGKVDIIVGTHRLLSKDVVFRDLGLLVVDEEDRKSTRLNSSHLVISYAVFCLITKIKGPVDTR